MKDDLKQVALEMAEAVFQRIEADRTLIKSSVADVLHKELAVRFPQSAEPKPVHVDSNPWSDDSWLYDAFMNSRYKHRGKTIKEFRPIYLGWDLAKGESKSVTHRVLTEERSDDDSPPGTGVA